MAKQTIDFAKLIQEDRETRQQQHWQGTFLEYLEQVKADAALANLAHRRLYDMIELAGVTEINPENEPRTQRLFGDEPIKVYNFFKDEFFGMERTLAKIVRYFHSAAMGGEESRQVLYLMGPVGSGKSSLVERLKRGLEELAADLRDRGLSDPRAAAPPDPAPSAAGVRGDAGRQDRGRPLPGLPLPPDGGVRRPLRGSPDPHRQLLQARPARHRRGAAGRPQQPGHLGADRLGGHLQARPLFRGRPAGPRAQRRLQRRQPRHGRVHRGVQERDRIPARHDHRDPGEVHPGAGSPRHDLRRHLHRRPLQRGRVAEVQGRPHQRGDPRPHRGGQGPLQPAAVGRGQDLPEVPGALEVRRLHRAPHPRDRLDVRHPDPPRADRQVRPDDQAPPVQRRGGGREGPHQEALGGRAPRGHQARGHVRDLDPLHHEGARQRAAARTRSRSIRSASARP